MYSSSSVQLLSLHLVILNSIFKSWHLLLFFLVLPSSLLLLCFYFISKEQSGFVGDWNWSPSFFSPTTTMYLSSSTLVKLNKMLASYRRRHRPIWSRAIGGGFGAICLDTIQGKWRLGRGDGGAKWSVCSDKCDTCTSEWRQGGNTTVIRSNRSCGRDRKLITCQLQQPAALGNVTYSQGSGICMFPSMSHVHIMLHNGGQQHEYENMALY